MTSDIVAEIKQSVDLTQFDLGTAEGRLALDTQLNEALSAIENADLRLVAYDMIKGWRREIFGTPTRTYYSAARVQSMLHEVTPTQAEVVEWLRAASGRSYDDFAASIVDGLRAKLDTIK